MRCFAISPWAWITALALLIGTHAQATPQWVPITFSIDTLSTLVGWSDLWQSSFSGVTDPQPKQVGWGPSQRVLDTTNLAADVRSDNQSVGIEISGRYTDVLVHGGRTPPPAGGGPIFDATVNSTAQPSLSKSPGVNGSAISFALPDGTSNVTLMPAGEGGAYFIDSISLRTMIMTNYTSADMIPTATEFFITNGTLNPRLTWTNASDVPSNRWTVQKGIADPTDFTTAGAPGGGPSLTPSATSPVATAAATGGGPSKDSGPEDYYQARAAGPEPAVDIPVPDGASFIVINGTVGPRRAPLKAVIAPAPPHWDGSADSDRSANAINVWSADTVLYMRELDPNVRYTVKLQAAPGEETRPTIGLHSITYYYGLDPAVNGTSTEGGNSNTAAIAGGVVGGVVGGLLLALVALYFCFWKPRKRREREYAEADARLEGASFTPYVQREVDGGTVVVPPSYDPAWANETAPSSSGQSGQSGSDSGRPLLASNNEKQLYAAPAGASVPSPSGASPITPVPDWKAPYLPAPHGSAPPTGAAAAATGGGVRGLLGRNGRGSHSGSAVSGEKALSGGSEKRGRSEGYSEGMLRPMNPDNQ